MQKPVKITLFVLGGIVLLLVVAVLTLMLVFDPNQYKDDIVRIVKEKTGRDFKIEQKIGWSFFPYLGVETGGLELGNAPGFGPAPFAKINSAGVRVAFLPLLRGKLEVDTIYLHDLNLALAKNRAGVTNWSDLAKADTKPEPVPEQPQEVRLPVEGLSLGKLDVRRAQITWRDETADSTMVLRKLNLTTGRFTAGTPMDVHLGLELARDKTAPVKISLDGKLTAAATSLKFDKLDLKLDDSRLTGTFEVRNFASPAFRFNLAVDRIDIDRYLGSAPADPAAQKPDATPAGKQPEPAEPSLAGLRSLDLDGKLRIQTLKAFNLKLSDAEFGMTGRNGEITLGPNRAKLYNGSYHGKIRLDVRGPQAKIQLDEKLDGVQTGPLLKDLKLFDHFTGVGNIVLKLSTQGLTGRTAKQNLNGTVTVALHDGRIDGVDFIKLIDQARALTDAARGKPVAVKASETDATVFKSLTASAQITNGQARNEDFILDGPNLRATGRGKANLVDETLDYRVKVTVAESAERRGTTLPLLIGGSFDKPTYSVDLGEVLKQEAQKQLQKGLEQLLLQPKKKK